MRLWRLMGKGAAVEELGGVMASRRSASVVDVRRLATCAMMGNYQDEWWIVMFCYLVRRLLMAAFGNAVCNAVMAFGLCG